VITGEKVMFGIEHFKPWIGKKYGNSCPGVMVIGESRYDEEYTDHRIVTSGAGGRTHTNFIQAVLCKRHWEEDYDPSQFWSKAIFYNYHTTFFPGEPRIDPKLVEQDNVRNRKMLARMLMKLRPTHCIVWGKRNWESIDVDGVVWSPETDIPALDNSHPYCYAESREHKTLFTYVKHPSTAFSFDHWTRVLSAFLAIENRDGQREWKDEKTGI
jgi:hypothetical protein